MHKHLIVASRAASFLQRLFQQSPMHWHWLLPVVSLIHAIRLPDFRHTQAGGEAGRQFNKARGPSRPPRLLSNGNSHLDPYPSKTFCPISSCLLQAQLDCSILDRGISFLRLELSSYHRACFFGWAILLPSLFLLSPRTNCQAKLGGVGGLVCCCQGFWGGYKQSRNKRSVICCSC